MKVREIILISKSYLPRSLSGRFIYRSRISSMLQNIDNKKMSYVDHLNNNKTSEIKK